MLPVPCLVSQALKPNQTDYCCTLLANLPHSIEGHIE